MSALLEAHGVSAVYRTSSDGPGIRAVDGVSVTLEEGESLGIAGESGCGKSTLAHILSINVRPPLRVTGGTLRVAGHEIVFGPGRSMNSEAHLRGKAIALLPQGAMNALNPTLRVRDLVFDVLRSHHPGVTREAAIACAAERFERLGLPARALNAYPHQLSGGMRQRVVAVISTLLDPDVLIADEPTSALDVGSQRALLALLSSLLEQRIIRGIIFITHELPLLRYVAHRVLIMYAGHVVEIGPTQEVLFEAAHPYTRALMDATIVLETGTRRCRIRTVGGSPPNLASPPPGCRFHPRCPVVMAPCSQHAPPRVTVRPRHTVACWYLDRPAAATAQGGESRKLPSSPDGR